MKLINKKKKYDFWFPIQGLCSIIDGLVRILSLGFLYSAIEYEFIKWVRFRKNN